MTSRRDPLDVVPEPRRAPAPRGAPGGRPPEPAPRCVGLVFAATLYLPHISQTPGGYRSRPTDSERIRSLIGGTERIFLVADSPTLIESSLAARTISVMAEYSYL